MDRFVVDLYLPEPLHMRLGVRRALNEYQAAYLGCRRGYWENRWEMDELGITRPVGVRLVVEFEATNIEDAEDKALMVGLRFGQVVTVYAGSPLSVPRLERVARVGPREGVFEQYNYYYVEGPDALPQVQLLPDELERLLSWFAVLNERVHERLELAARWYGMSVGAQDPLDGYLSVWIGLESMGPVLNERVHPEGQRAACVVCGNQPGRRDRGEAGIQHAIKQVAPELLEGRDLQDLANVRNDIAHGLEAAGSLRISADQLLADLQLALIFGIITAARPTTSAPGSGKAILPRDFKVYPDARNSVRSEVELVFHKPYFGEWIEVDRIFEDMRSRVEADGAYIWGAQTRIASKTTVAEAPQMTREYVIFERLGRRWTEVSIDDAHPSIPVVPWRIRPLSPAWQRYVSPNVATNSSNTEDGS